MPLSNHLSRRLDDVEDSQRSRLIISSLRPAFARHRNSPYHAESVFPPEPPVCVLAHRHNFRVMGPDPTVLRSIAGEVERVMRANPRTRQVNEDWGNRVPTEHFVLDQSRLRLLGLSTTEVAQQLQFLLTDLPITQVREGIRIVEVVARSSGPDRLDPARLTDLTGGPGAAGHLSQLGGQKTLDNACSYM